MHRRAATMMPPRNAPSFRYVTDVPASPLIVSTVPSPLSCHPSVHPPPPSFLCVLCLFPGNYPLRHASAPSARVHFTATPSFSPSGPPLPQRASSLCPPPDSSSFSLLLPLTLADTFPHGVMYGAALHCVFSMLGCPPHSLQISQ